MKSKSKLQNSGNLALAIAIFLAAPSVQAEITLVNTSTTASGSVPASVSAPLTVPFSTTVSGYDMGATANTLAIFFTAENSTSLTVTFDGVPMTVVAVGTYHRAGIAYLINPTATVGDIVISSNYSIATNRTSWEYNIISLANVGSVAGTATRTTDGNLSYTTTDDGGYVLGVAANNNAAGPAPAVTGRPDMFLANGAFDTNHSVIHAHGEVPLAGLYADNYTTLAAAATVAFNPVPGGYDSWKSIVGNQTPSEDFDLDGVSNGVEYFMNSIPGFTANPSPDGTKKVTWTNGGNIPSGDYGTQYVVEKSTNLVNWQVVPNDGSDTNLVVSPGSVSYTINGTDKQFVRLKVTPN